VPSADRLQKRYRIPANPLRDEDIAPRRKRVGGSVGNPTRSATIPGSRHDIRN
jgi:hypothetical protein